MADYTAETGLELTVSLALLVLAATLLASSRRSAAHWTLAAFLVAVGANFLGIAMAIWTGHLAWAQAAYIGLAVDPMLLLLFVVRHPYPRRPRGYVVAVIALGLAAIFTVAVTLAAPHSLISMFTSSSIRSPARTVPIVAMAVGYSLAFGYAVAATARAPTLGLARSAAWTLAAVGLAVVPRLGLVPNDVGLGAWDVLVGPWPSDASGILLRNVVDLMDTAAIVATTLGVAFFVAGRGPRPEARLVRRALALVAVFTSALLAIRLFFYLWERLGGTLPALGQSLAYAPRWIVFGVLLVHGLLAHEVLQVRRGFERAAPWVGGLVLGAGVALVGSGITRVPVALVLGGAAVVPAGFAVRGFLRSLRTLHGVPESTRSRLELYRASLEAAWRQGTPDAAARHRLDAERARLGLSVDEALALEHVVSSDASAGPRPLASGDEPVPGLIIEDLLGEGSQARVWRARRLPAGESVVVKEYRREAFADGPRTRDRIRREVEVLSGLRHPNIPRLIEARFADGRCLLLREDVGGRPLSESLVAGPLTQQRVETLARQLLGALGAVHARGFVHRDVKPDNILVDDEGHAWLADFDVAETVRVSPAVTATRFEAVGGFAGSLAYMAPEQAREGMTGPSSDLYALGLVLYEALSGRPALRLRGLGPFAALQAVVRPRVDWSRLSPRWRVILRRALDPKPSRRYPDAGVFLNALGRPQPRTRAAAQRTRQGLAPRR